MLGIFLAIKASLRVPHKEVNDSYFSVCVKMVSLRESKIKTSTMPMSSLSVPRVFTPLDQRSGKEHAQKGTKTRGTRMGFSSSFAMSIPTLFTWELTIPPHPGSKVV